MYNLACLYDFMEQFAENRTLRITQVEGASC